MSPLFRRSLPVLAVLVSLASPVRAQVPLPFDIDGNNLVEPATDGTLIIRYLFGYSGTPLIQGAIGSGATRTTASAIRTYLDSIASQLDVDGNGLREALTDGVLIRRFLSGFSGDALIANAVGANATRTTAAAIQAYLTPLAGTQVFASGLTFSPDTVDGNAGTVVTTAVALRAPGLSASIDLLETDASGAGASKVATLFDDGDLAKGDDIAADGIYHATFGVAAAGFLDKYYVARDPASGQRSVVSRLPVVKPLTSEALEKTLTFNTTIDDLVKGLVAQGTSWDAVVQQVLAALAANPAEVVTYGRSDSGNGVWWVTKDEVLVALQETQYRDVADDERQAVARRPGAIPAELKISPVLPELFAAPRPRTGVPGVFAAAGDVVRTDSNRALVLAPYAFQFEPFDESDEIAAKLTSNGFDVTMKRNAAVSVADFVNMSAYGVVVITTHGDNYFNLPFTVWQSLFGESIPWWAESSSQVIVLTGTPIDLGTFIAYAADLVSQRLVLTPGNTLAITPSFVRTRSGAFPNSLVYIGSCRSTFNSTMANAFISKGAKAFLGFSDYVGSSFAFNHANTTFDELLAGRTTGELTGFGDMESDSDPARYDRFGIDNLVVLGDLRNGTFELGTLTGWNREGDTRVITGLGPLRPTEGVHFAIISTGLGSVTESSSRIYQQFIVPNNATRLRGSYDFVSEEPMEWINAGFDDKFEARIIDGATSTLIASERIDTSTWIAIGGIDFAGGDTTVFHTGFKNLDIDMTPYRGRVITLEFKVFDVGDSIYDSAALLDNLRIEKAAAPLTALPVTGVTQTVSLSKPAWSGGGASFEVDYATAPANGASTGIGVRVYFDSAKLTFANASNIVPQGFLGVAGPFADASNGDGDPSTDSFVILAWADIETTWPGLAQARLFVAIFARGGSAGGTSTMRLGGDASGGGTIAGSTLAIQPPTYYLAEGATGGFFDLDIGVMNPNGVAVPIVATFLKADATTVVQNYTLAPTSRFTIRADSVPGLAATAVSAVIRSDAWYPVVVERTMFWDPSYYGAHGGNAVDEPATTWYFAEGSQGFFDTYVLLANANATAADVTVTFLLEAGAPVVRTFPVAPTSRFNVYAGSVPELVGKSFSIVVNATQPIIAERAMYFGVPLFNGGHESAGVRSAASTWFLAEGATGAFFDTYVLIGNPNPSAANVVARFLTEAGQSITKTFLLPGNSRLTINVEDQDAALADTGVSTTVTSDVPVVVERAMYWPGAFVQWYEAHNSFGSTEVGLRWGLAEGRVGTSRGFETYILLANGSTTQAAEVRITYMRADGTTVVKNYSVGPTTRFNVHVNGMVPELANEEFSALVEVTNGVGIFVERALYSSAPGAFWNAGTNALATKLP